jgi:hypothetical protein
MHLDHLTGAQVNNFTSRWPRSLPQSKLNRLGRSYPPALRTGLLTFANFGVKQTPQIGLADVLPDLVRGSVDYD